MDELEAKVAELTRAGYTVRLVAEQTGWACTLFKAFRRIDADGATAADALDAAVQKKGGA